MADPEIGLPRTSSDLEDGNNADLPVAHHTRKASIHDKDYSADSSSRSSATDGNGPIEWHYLTWNTDLPPPAFSTVKDVDQTKLPSPATYEKYISPFTWSPARKRFITWLSCAATTLTAYVAGSYTAADTQMEEYWHVSHVAITVGVTIFTTGFGLAPMVLAPFSEINGRRPMFVVTGVLFVILQLCCAVTRSYPGMLVARFFVGCMSSTFSTMVGGVVSDIYHAEDRNTAMALFSGAALFGTGLGPLISGFIATRTTWRWIFYSQVIADALLMVCIVLFFKETRGSVLLSRKAKKINKYYEQLEALGIVGVHMPAMSDMEKPLQQTDMEKPVLRRIRWKVTSDEERASLATMIGVSIYRPFHLLFTEPTVFFFSLWISFAWAVLYLTFGAIPLVFINHHGFTLDQAGAVFTAISIAGIISTIIAITAEKYLRRTRPELLKSPEGRLWPACIQSILLPIGLFWFAWTQFSSIPWIVPTLAIGCATMGIYSIYLAVFNYLADTYHKYASSALAAQSMCRNLLGGALPLFVDQMFNGMTYQGAGSLLGGLGLILTAVPFVLAIWGPQIRKRSKIASQIMQDD